MTIISIILINYRLLQYQFIVKYTLLSFLKSSLQKFPTLHNFQLHDFPTFPYGRIIIRPYFPSSIPNRSNQPNPKPFDSGLVHKISSKIPIVFPVFFSTTSVMFQVLSSFLTHKELSLRIVPSKFFKALASEYRKQTSSPFYCHLD